MRLKKGAAALALWLLLTVCAAAALALTVDASRYPVTKDGWYSTMEEVSVYLATYGGLPGNYLTKREAQNLGWDNRRGNLWQVAEGCSIGGDRFGNYEGNLPDAKGRRWTECDIDYEGGYRGGKRICFSSDGLIYYSANHYRNFEKVTVVFPGQAAATAAPKEQGKAAATAVPKEQKKRALVTGAKVNYGESYTAWQDVAAYLMAYGELPVNYITLDEAKELGFSSKRDNMGEVAPEFTIGGGVFGNREGLLPAAEGREWRECDVDVGKDGRRGKNRLVWSNDGLYYLTRDKHKSFTEVKGE